MIYDFSSRLEIDFVLSKWESLSNFKMYFTCYDKYMLRIDIIYPEFYSKI